MEEKVQNLLQSEAATDTSEMEGKYLTFWTDEQLFGIPIADVVQIVGMYAITEVPEFPRYAKGIINLRGSIIPIIDIRLRFEKPEVPYNERTCIIVTSINEIEVGFIVDSVNEVTNIPEEEIAAPPKMSNQDVTNAYLTGVGKHDGKVILLMDTQKILNGDQINTLTNTR